MDVPYGFDCYTFGSFEMRHFEQNMRKVQSSVYLPGKLDISQSEAHQGNWMKRAGGTESNNNNKQAPGYIRFTRKNEDYSKDQVEILSAAGRLNKSEVEVDSKQMFCGTKIQLGIGVVTNFMQMGLQYRKPIKGRAEFVNGTWRGIVSGLTDNANKPTSYDLAFGNFLAYDEEFPYMKFGPIYAIESKLVLLTGSARRVEASSFGTNIDSQLWLIVLALIIALALMASLLVHWQQQKYRLLDGAIRQLMKRQPSGQIEQRRHLEAFEREEHERLGGLLHLMGNFIFIYLTMLLQKPCMEFDDLIWPRQAASKRKSADQAANQQLAQESTTPRLDHRLLNMLQSESGSSVLARHYKEMINSNRRWRRMIPTSIRALSYIWSSSCFIMVSIYSGEMLAVILLHTDQNIDNIQQLISAQPAIEPVIRHDDFTYSLMLKSLDKNMILLHNMTQLVDRRHVYSREFIEDVSKRKKALLGDDELIETLYDIYSQHFPLYRSKTTYLQYPISIMYRKDLNVSLETNLRRGIVQLFEMGLMQRWNEAQKQTYIGFYDKQNKELIKNSYNQAKNNTSSVEGEQTSEASRWKSEQKYKPLSVNNFTSFFKLVCLLFTIALLVLILEIVTFKLQQPQPIGHLNNKRTII